MVVRVVYTVTNVPSEAGLSGNVFMTTIKCHYNIKMQALHDHLQKLYPFLIIDGITDLDHEPAMMTQELRDVWKGYLSYQEGEMQDEEEEEGEEEEEEEEEEEADNTSIPLPSEPISLCVKSHYFSSNPNDLIKLNQLIKNNPYSKEFIDDSQQYNICDNEYSIKFPNGIKYKFNGHSYDSLEGTDTLVDQLLTSSEKYVISNTETEEFVELSTQQCIIVDSFSNGSPFKPYIMVNKSGLRELEKLGPIDTLKIRFGNKETDNTTTGNIIDNGTNTNSYQSVFSAYSELVGLFLDINNSDLKMNNHEVRVLKKIENELFPLLENISVSMGEPAARSDGWRITRICKGATDLLKRFYNSWISNGLIITIVSSLLHYSARNAIFTFILYRLHLNYNYLIGGMLFLGLLDANILSMIEKISTEGGIRWFSKIHSFLVKCRGFAQLSVEQSFALIVGICLKNRPVYNGGNTINESEQEAETLRLQRWRGFGRAVYPLMRVLQDTALCVVTLFPPGTTELDNALARRTHSD